MSGQTRIIQLEEGWLEIRSKAIEKLEDLLDQGIDRNTKPFDPSIYAPIYTDCYNMCTQRSPYNWSEQLYQRHGETISNYLTTKVLPSLRDKRDYTLLSGLVTRWEYHVVMNKWMRKFFMYLDRYYVKHHSLPTLHNAGLKNFKNLVFDVVKRDAMASVLAMIDKEREGEVVDRDLLKKVTKVYEAMGMKKLDIYVADFEEPLLTGSAEFYKIKSQEWVASDSTPDYMMKAERALKEEKERVTNYLNVNSESKLLRVCEKELLAKHEMVHVCFASFDRFRQPYQDSNRPRITLLEKENSGCKALLRDDKKGDLARMFSLFSRIENGLPPMCAIVRDHITKMGEAIISQREDKIKSNDGKDSASDPWFVQALLDLHDKYRAVVETEFSGHQLFQKALKEAFEDFVNSDVGKHTNAEMISTFCDRVLKTGGDKLSEQQIEEALDKAVQLFSYLQDKDLFSEIYRNQLAKRLLNQRSKSDDAERSMISKLKLRCGAQFTGKMEGMVTDLRTVGKDGKKKFQQYCLAKASEEGAASGDGASESKASSASTIVVTGGIDFSVDVLTTGYWPTYKVLELNLPPEMARCIEVFSEYYKSETEHRRLKWVHSLGQVTVKAAFKKNYDLVLTTLQAVALVHFNSVADWVTFTEVQQAIGLEEDVMKKVLHSLACSKYKVLKKNPKSNKIRKDDKFCVNQDFKNNMRKVRLPMASLEESHNPKRVEDDRTIAIEAAIVRIMKARKLLRHNELIAEVMQQLHFFKPQPKVVKKRIEHLIEREYLERDPEDATSYKYLA